MLGKSCKIWRKLILITQSLTKGSNDPASSYLGNMHSFLALRCCSKCCMQHLLHSSITPMPSLPRQYPEFHCDDNRFVMKFNFVKLKLKTAIIFSQPQHFFFNCTIVHYTKIPMWLWLLSPAHPQLMLLPGIMCGERSVVQWMKVYWNSGCNNVKNR
jgi:hypothetical protein